MGAGRRDLGKLLRERQGSTMVEFAIIAPVFLLMLFFVFQVAYDQYLGVVLQATVQNLAHEIQIGAATGDATGPSFLAADYCPAGSAPLLGCNNLFVRVQHFSSASCTDLYTATQGTLPVDSPSGSKTLELGLYFNANGTGQGTQVGPTSCTVNSTAYCNAGPNETIILTGIYVSPSLILGLIPGISYTYNNSQVVAQIAGVGFQTENFTDPTNSCGT